MAGNENSGRQRIEITPEQIIQIEALASYLSREQIADYLGITRETLRARMQENPVIEAAFNRGKAGAVVRIAKGLIERAEEGDVAAARFYLSTQAGWNETQRMEHSGPNGGPIPTQTTVRLEFVNPDPAKNGGGVRPAVDDAGQV